MSKKSTIVTAANFNTKLSSAVKRTTTVKNDLQELLMFGLAHYGSEAQDTCYLTKCVKACVGVGALDTRKMREYLQTHANIAWTKIEIKSGKDAGKVDYVFKKKGDHAEVSLPDYPWFDFEKAPADKPAIDVLMKLANFRKMIAKEINDQHVTDVAMARRVLEAIDFDLATLTAPEQVKLKAA